jgi:hypothetical protein
MPETSNRKPTEAQLAFLRWLSNHPGRGEVFGYYDRPETPFVRGMELVSRRGAAGRMRHRLEDHGWITQNEELTDAGHEAVARHA